MSISLPARHRALVPMVLVSLCALATGGTMLWTAPAALASGDANETTCPNEALPGFRAYLPDCRAYEMVTPPYKGAAAVNVNAVSPDGNHLIVDSLGAFAGTASDPLDRAQGAIYDLSRSASGWVGSPLTPPASLSPNALLLGISADTSRTAWEVLGSSKSIYAADLDVREADGTLVKIGPLIPPAAAAGPPAGGSSGLSATVEFAGASKDLSHVLFKIAAVDPTILWPGDTTQPETTARSLYEYAGTGNTHPELVGVNNEGHLISSCETTLGSTTLEEGSSAYNAVSATGDTVFFTAVGHSVASGCKGSIEAPEVSELYARLDGSQTVAISEPSHAQCERCKTAVRKTVAFQGASEDGSKAFFLTEQELFPGALTKNLYEYDFDNVAGEKIVRVSSGSPEPEVQGVMRVSEDGSHVYYVAKAALAGINAEGQSPVSGANNLYVFERDAAYPGGHTTFIATLSESDEQDWEQRDGRPAQATPEGRFLVFRSVADLTSGDTSTAPQIFEYDALRERLVRVSIGAAGDTAGSANANANPSSISTQQYGESFEPTTATTKLAVSADGSRVLFKSRGALTEGAQAAATAGAGSVYEYRSVGPIEDGNVYLISDGMNVLSPENFGLNEVIGLDASGGDAFFQTADPLLAADVDTQFDVYDARSDGGFPAPVAPAVCQGDACQGAPSVAPLFAASGSTAAVSGAGNLAPAASSPASPPVTFKPKPKPKRTMPKCSKGRRFSHGKCVKTTAKKGKVKAKRAGNDRRGRR